MKYENNTGLPSVSDIIGPYEDSRWYKEEHQDRGNFVHGYIAADLSGLMTPGTIPIIYEPYIGSYRAFKRHIVKVVLVEKRLTSKLGFCGKPDTVLQLDEVYGNLTWLIDWKTSQSHQKSWDARLGGYCRLLKEHGITVGGAATVRLRGSASKTKGLFPLLDKMNPQEIKESEIDFLSAFRVYNNIMKDGKVYAGYHHLEGII